MEIHGHRSGGLRRHESGYCAEGPGFYVWDEDPALPATAPDAGTDRP